MIDKRTFTNLLNSLEKLSGGMSNLETALNVKFDNNFITDHIDTVLITIAQSFITKDYSDLTAHEVALETVTDILFHYVITSEFGLKTSKLKRLYVEDEGLDTEVALDATTESELYDLIVRYLNPPVVCKTYTIYC